MKSRLTFVLFLLLAPYCRAQTDFAALKASFESAVSDLDASCATQKADALAAYGKSLDSLALSLRQDGDLDGYLAVEAEKKRFAAEKKVVEDDSAVRHSGVLMLSRKCRASVAKAEQYKNAKSVALLKSYVVQLDAMVKQLVKQDKIEPAKKVQEELKKAKFMLADAESKMPAPPVAKAPEPASEPKQPPAPQPAGGSRTIDLGDGIKMEFVLIPAGSFAMGSERSDGPPTKVTITKPFYMAKHEVTQEQWEALMGGNPSNTRGGKNPVETVSWADCQSFISKLKEEANGMEVRLPTSAEWEYACRAGSKADFCYGNDEVQLSQYAWYLGNSEETTHPVGEKKPNSWGLCDMHGNVWEWCSDWAGEADGPVAKKDPAGPASGTARTRRGGSFQNEAGECKSASCIGLGPEDRVSDVGFRVVIAIR